MQTAVFLKLCIGTSFKRFICLLTLHPSMQLLVINRLYLTGVPTSKIDIGGEKTGNGNLVASHE